MKDNDFYSNDFQKNARKSQWYDDVTRNLTKCPFCDLKSKYIILENENAVLTVNLFPYIDGHLMVIPKRHVEKFTNLQKEEWSSFRKLIDVGIKLINKELKVENTNILYREGKKSGMSLKHIHIHVLPITEKFMRYEKQRFVMEFQEINFTPIEITERLRRAWKKL